MLHVLTCLVQAVYLDYCDISFRARGVKTPLSQQPFTKLIPLDVHSVRGVSDSGDSFKQQPGGRWLRSQEIYSSLVNYK